MNSIRIRKKKGRQYQQKLFLTQQSSNQEYQRSLKNKFKISKYNNVNEIFSFNLLYYVIYFNIKKNPSKINCIKIHTEKVTFYVY